MSAPLPVSTQRSCWRAIVAMAAILLVMRRGTLSGSKRHQAKPDPAGDMASLKAEAARLNARIESLEVWTFNGVER